LCGISAKVPFVTSKRYRPSLLLLAIVVLAGLAAAPGRAADEDFWGRKLAGQPTNFIFGYGSLINSQSRNSTAVAPIPAIPARVSAAFGYIRTWNDRSASGFTALGLRRPSLGEPARTINGVLYPVDGDDMSKFDAREEGYVRVEIPSAQIEAVGWQPLPAAGHIWVYVPEKPANEGGAGQPGVGLPEPDAEFPLLESYIDVVVEGGLEYGPEFAREILETTDGWSRYWLNDRELARRPWVRDVNAAWVDAILGRSPAAAALMKGRLFPEDFAVRLLIAPAR
jgi:hypothetical protein